MNKENKKNQNTDAPYCASCNPSEEDIFIREVSEEVRLNKIREWWKENGTFIVMLGFSILLGVIIRQGLNWYRFNKQNTETQMFEASSANLEALKNMSNEFSYGYQKVAQSELIEAYQHENKYDEVIKILEAQTQGDAYEAELAHLKLAYAKADSEPQAALKEAQIVVGGKYFKYLGQELILSLQSNEKEQKKFAQKIIQDENASSYLKKIAAMYLLK